MSTRDKLTGGGVDDICGQFTAGINDTGKHSSNVCTQRFPSCESEPWVVYKEQDPLAVDRDYSPPKGAPLPKHGISARGFFFINISKPFFQKNQLGPDIGDIIKWQNAQH